MKTKTRLCLPCIILAWILCSCKPTHIDLPTFIYLGEIIEIDSLLKNNSSYYKTYTFMCDADTIFQYKYTNLLAPGQPIKAQFIPGTAFSQYSQDVTDNFAISPSILEWYNPQEYVEVSQLPTPGTNYHVWIKVDVYSVYRGDQRSWVLLDTTDAPKKIYYYYDWESKAHYDYMRYNADSAIITLSVSNIDADNITPIDSAWIYLPASSIKQVHTLFPIEIKDTINIVNDTTYNYTFTGYLKGQRCGINVLSLRIHKNEIVSDQDQTYRHQGYIYGYKYE